MKKPLLLFDIGNVVIQADHAITFKFLENLGVSSANSKKFYNNPEYKEYSRGKLSSDDFYEALIEKYLKQPLSYQQVREAHNRHIYAADAELLVVLQELKESKHDIAFLTDTNEWQTSREKELVDVSAFSKRVLRSHEMGTLKTDEGTFEFVASELKTEPRELFLIDDSQEKIDLAKEFGYKTHLFTHAAKLRQELMKLGYLE